MSEVSIVSLTITGEAMHIHFVIHESFEGPGYFEYWLLKMVSRWIDRKIFAEGLSLI